MALVVARASSRAPAAITAVRVAVAVLAAEAWPTIRIDAYEGGGAHRVAIAVRGGVAHRCAAFTIGSTSAESAP